MVRPAMRCRSADLKHEVLHTTTVALQGLHLRTSILMVCLAAAALIACSTVQPPSKPQPLELLGTWKVDLRPTPDAAPYFQEFVVTQVEGKAFNGTFYGSPISQGRLNTAWGTVRIAFVTADGSGPYNHSAVLSGGRLEGLTNSTARDFLSYWSASKQ